MTRYQVTAPCVVHIPTVSATGPSLGTFYRDAILPEGVPENKIRHLLESGMIAVVGGADPAPAKQDGEQVEQPATTVNARSSKGDLIEHGVSQGGDRAELEALTREELLNRYVRQQP